MDSLFALLYHELFITIERQKLSEVLKQEKINTNKFHKIQKALACHDIIYLMIF